MDFCMGFGSTGVAALEEGRRFIGIEKDRMIFAQAEARLKIHPDSESYPQIRR